MRACNNRYHSSLYEIEYFVDVLPISFKAGLSVSRFSGLTVVGWT